MTEAGLQPNSEHKHQVVVTMLREGMNTWKGKRCIVCEMTCTFCVLCGSCKLCEPYAECWTQDWTEDGESIAVKEKHVWNVQSTPA